MSTLRLKAHDKDFIGDLIPLDEFDPDCCSEYDGSGVYATLTHESNVEVDHEALRKGKKPDPIFTHVLWFNK